MINTQYTKNYIQKVENQFTKDTLLQTNLMGLEQPTTQMATNIEKEYLVENDCLKERNSIQMGGLNLKEQ